MAVNCCVWPMLMAAAVGATAIESSVGLLTVKTAVLERDAGEARGDVAAALGDGCGETAAAIVATPVLLEIQLRLP